MNHLYRSDSNSGSFGYSPGSGSRYTKKWNRNTSTNYPRAQVCGRGGAPPERRPGPHRRAEARAEEREQVHVGAVRLLGLQRGGRRVQQAAPHLGQLQARLHSAHHRVPGTGEKVMSNFLLHCQFSILYSVYRII